ncbi:MAG: hypothetical protein QM820_05670 [Minicystis sp.]
MATVLRWFFRGFLLLFVVIELITLAVAILGPDGVIGGPNPEEMRWGMGAGAVIALVITLASFKKTPLDEMSDALAKQSKERRQREERVAREGWPATAVIVARESERENDGDIDADLTLEIRVAGRAPYRVPYLWSEPEDHAAERMRVGREQEARVDPTDPSFVVVSWSKGRWHSTRRV